MEFMEEKFKEAVSNLRARRTEVFHALPLEERYHFRHYFINREVSLDDRDESHEVLRELRRSIHAWAMADKVERYDAVPLLTWARFYNSIEILRDCLKTCVGDVVDEDQVWERQRGTTVDLTPVLFPECGQLIGVKRGTRHLADHEITPRGMIDKYIVGSHTDCLLRNLPRSYSLDGEPYHYNRHEDDDSSELSFSTSESESDHELY